MKGSPVFKYLKLKGVLVTFQLLEPRFQLGVARCSGCRLKKEKRRKRE
jgi:hypothetical protein